MFNGNNKKSNPKDGKTAGAPPVKHEDKKDQPAKTKRFVGQEEYQELENKYKRALADYQNLLKRTAQEKAEFMKFANEQLLYTLLPVYDNLKISLAHIDDAAQANGWAEGIKYVIKQFKDALRDLGVEEIKAKGQKFDHHTMEAVEGQGEKVKQEIKTGYKLHGKVIVPAKVILE